ncbi:MAG TPA: ATP-binding cassette domain-containing protein, partial [Sphingomicrobium sp.]|nr:ATP-binding cassette domain-containing protein [Sphingomicrobium sp.]
MLAIMIAGRSGGIAAALPFLAALALGALRLLPLTSQLYGAWASLAVAAPILTDVAALLRLPLDHDTQVPDATDFHRSIELDAVGFHYPDRAHRAIDDIGLTIPKGARVAITGRTGSGKSTLADLLMGLIEPGEGSILIDGVPLTTDRLPGWRRSVAHVPQEIFLADDSIAANIALSFRGGEEDDDRVKAAARQAQLHDFIETLPDGYDTRIGERGVRLSGGQRQRLALARALYKRAPVLVLDEPTSSLDEQTEMAIIGAMDELQSSGITIVIIAHRLSTMAKCNPIYVLDEGRLVRSGSFAELFGKLPSVDQTS